MGTIYRSEVVRKQCPWVDCGDRRCDLEADHDGSHAYRYGGAFQRGTDWAPPKPPASLNRLLELARSLAGYRDWDIAIRRMSDAQGKDVFEVTVLVDGEEVSEVDRADLQQAISDSIAKCEETWRLWNPKGVSR